MLAEMQEVSNRQAARAIDCLCLTSAAIDQAYRRYWEQTPRPTPLHNSQFCIRDHRNRPWTLKDSQNPDPGREPWQFQNTVVHPDTVARHADRHANDPAVVLIGKKVVAKGRASAASASKVKSTVKKGEEKEERAVSP